MEKISTENIISALFILGFDRIDPALFTFTLGKLSLEDKGQHFAFEEQETSNGFKQYVDCSGVVIRIKDGYALDTNVSTVDSYEVPVKKRLFVNRELLAFLNEMDFGEIVAKKAELYGVKSVSDANPNLFCEKEIAILSSKQIGSKTETLKS